MKNKQQWFRALNSVGNVCAATLNVAREIRKEYTPILEYSKTVTVPRIYYMLHKEIGKRMAKYDEAWALYCALDEKQMALCQEPFSYTWTRPSDGATCEGVCEPISRGHVA